MTELQLSQSTFATYRYYIITAIIFLDFGILFGGLNALRVAEIFNVPEIHRTHWTSTLFGGMTVIMLGLLLYQIGLNLKVNIPLKILSIIVLILIILAAISSYIVAWDQGNPLGMYFMPLIKLAALLYTLMVVYAIIFLDRRQPLLEEPAYYMIYAAVIWMAISLLYFLGYTGVIGPEFLTTYIYGFFSLTLFGTLSMVLPRIYGTKPRPKTAILRDTVMLSLSATLLLFSDLFESDSTLMGFVGTICWGLVGFLFILYIFDLMFKTGISPVLLGLSVALIMFGFFVMDTLMKSVFPIWVTASHVHFMFLGTLVISIIAVGLQFLSSEIDQIQMSSKTQSIVIFTSIILIGTILLSFTLQVFAIAGVAGILFFLFLISFELTLVWQVIT